MFFTINFDNKFGRYFKISFVVINNIFKYEKLIKLKPTFLANFKLAKHNYQREIDNVSVLLPKLQSYMYQKSISLLPSLLPKPNDTNKKDPL